MFLQPRAQNPAGSALTPRRAKALAGAARPTRDTIVIEDDHANDISSAPLVSLGRWLPERTVHIRSFSKSHGPDLRLAAVGGAGDVVTAVANRRLLGPGWSSRILQALLLELLRDPATPEVMAAARATYARRRALVSDVLAAHGVDVTGGDGINLWMRVADERSADRRAGGPRHRRRARRPVPRAPRRRPRPGHGRPDHRPRRRTSARSPTTSPPPPAVPAPAPATTAELEHPAVRSRR